VPQECLSDFRPEDRLARSTFFQGIIGGKSLGDTQTNLTVPILDRL
jgi:hypothetical protein